MNESCMVMVSGGFEFGKSSLLVPVSSCSFQSGLCNFNLSNHVLLLSQIF